MDSRAITSGANERKRCSNPFNMAGLKRCPSPPKCVEASTKILVLSVSDTMVLRSSVAGWFTVSAYRGSRVRKHVPIQKAVPFSRTDMTFQGLSNCATEKVLEEPQKSKPPPDGLEVAVFGKGVSRVLSYACYSASRSSVWDARRRAPRAAFFARQLLRVTARGFPRFRAFEPCTGWGLPSRPCLQGRWCALTAPFHPDWSVVQRFIFCCTVRRLRACSKFPSSGSLAAQPLAGILPCGARTFLTRVASGATVPLSSGRV